MRRRCLKTASRISASPPMSIWSTARERASCGPTAAESTWRASPPQMHSRDRAQMRVCHGTLSCGNRTSRKPTAVGSSRPAATAAHPLRPISRRPRTRASAGPGCEPDERKPLTASSAWRMRRHGARPTRPRRRTRPRATRRRAENRPEADQQRPRGLRGSPRAHTSEHDAVYRKRARGRSMTATL